MIEPVAKMFRLPYGNYTIIIAPSIDDSYYTITLHSAKDPMHGGVFEQHQAHTLSGLIDILSKYRDIINKKELDYDAK